MIFHIADIKEYTTAVSGGSVYRPSSYKKEGFIHCSGPLQVADTLHRHFAAADKLLLLAIDIEAEREHLRYEDLYQRGQAFPHIYRPLPLSSILGTYLLERIGGQFPVPFSWMEQYNVR